MHQGRNGRKFPGTYVCLPLAGEAQRRQRVEYWVYQKEPLPGKEWLFSCVVSGTRKGYQPLVILAWSAKNF